MNKISNPDIALAKILIPLYIKFYCLSVIIDDTKVVKRRRRKLLVSNIMNSSHQQYIKGGSGSHDKAPN